MTVLPEAVLTAGAIGASPSVGSDDTSVSPAQSTFAPSKSSLEIKGICN